MSSKKESVLRTLTVALLVCRGDLLSLVLLWTFFLGLSAGLALYELLRRHGRSAEELEVLHLN